MYISHAGKLLITFPILMLTGCAGLINPHVVSTKLDDDLELSTADKYQFPTELNKAFDAANDQRRKYYNAIGARNIIRNLSGIALLGLSAATVYKNVTPGVSSETQTKFNTLLAGVGGSIYGISTFYSNKDAEMAYLSGYKLTTCTLLKMRPYIMTQKELQTWSNDIEELNKVSKEMDEISLLLSSRLLHKSDKDVDDMIKAQKNGRTTYNNATKLKSNLETAGYTLRRQVELINAAVSEHIQQNERDISGLSGLLTEPGKLTKGFDAIRPIPLELDLEDIDPTEKSKKNKAEDEKIKTAKDNLPLAEEKLKTAQRASKKNKVEISKLQEEINDYKRTIDKAAPKALPTEILLKKEEGLKKMAELYQVRRTVLAKIANFNALKKTVKHIPVCNFSAHPELKVAPDEDETTITAGGKYEVKMSGGAGYPIVALEGVKDKLASVQTLLNGTELVAQVSTDEKSPDGDITLHITDAHGSFPQTTIIHVKAKPSAPATPPVPPAPPIPPAPPAPPASK